MNEFCFTSASEPLETAITARLAGTLILSSSPLASLTATTPLSKPVTFPATRMGWACCASADTVKAATKAVARSPVVILMSFLPKVLIATEYSSPATVLPDQRIQRLGGEAKGG